MDTSMPARSSAPRPTRRVLAVGVTRRSGGRTVTMRATPAGVTGTIAPAVKR